jgi:cephalosporin-C deacetylase-like acetyl esterase
LKKQWLAIGLGGLLAFSAASAADAPAPPDGRQKLVSYLDALAHKQLAQRADAIAALKTEADARARQKLVRATILELIGGLPPRNTPLNAKVHGGFHADGFRVENITYDSLPGYHVTANVLIPDGKGPFPAVIIAPGHGPDGKLDDYNFAANFARNGILVLSYDIVGEGERLQHYDPQIGASKVGHPTGEHSMAANQTALIGQHVSRYFIQDALRGVDYLAARPDVDAKRLAAFGCSGGGTLTAYTAALDPRIKVAGVACYSNDFAHLLASVGPQDAEQSIPDFLARGLDIADWLELAAPHPFAIIATTEDMFPFAGAQAAHDEAAKFWGLFGASDKLAFITGPGPHGNLGPISPQILAFFTKNLLGTPPSHPFETIRADRESLLVTKTGQLSTSLGGETIQSLAAAQARHLAAPKPVLHNGAELAAFQARIANDARRLPRVSAVPGAPPLPAETLKSESRNGYRFDTLRLHSDDFDIDATLGMPSAAGRKKAVLVLGLAPPPRRGPSLTDQLVAKGYVVMSIAARGAGGTEELKSALLGDYTLVSLRAFLVGKTIIGMRVDDTIRALDWLSAQPDVDPQAITVYARGNLGPVALHAAVLDKRIAGLYLDSMPGLYRYGVDRSIVRDYPEIALYGVLEKYDLDDLMLAVAPRPVTLIAPQNGVGEPLRHAILRRDFASVRRNDKSLKMPDQLGYCPDAGFGAPVQIP